MNRAATVLTLFSAVEHVWFFVLEAILWRTPFGLKTFGLDEQRAEATAQLAVNQGFYNLLLAAGLAWAALSPHRPLKLYTLGFVVIAGIVGGVTASPGIFLVQALPAAIALGLLLAAGRGGSSNAAGRQVGDASSGPN